MIDPEPANQLERDITKWAEMRLRQWALDSAERFDQAGIPMQRALVGVMTLLISMAVQLVARCSAIPARVFGTLVVSLVRRERRAEKESDDE